MDAAELHLTEVGEQLRERDVRVCRESTHRREESVVRKVFEGAVVHSFSYTLDFWAPGLPEELRLQPATTLETIPSRSGLHARRGANVEALMRVVAVRRRAAPEN